MGNRNQGALSSSAGRAARQGHSFNAPLSDRRSSRSRSSPWFDKTHHPLRLTIQSPGNLRFSVAATTAKIKSELRPRGREHAPCISVRLAIYSYRLVAGAIGRYFSHRPRKGATRSVVNSDARGKKETCSRPQPLAFVRNTFFFHVSPPVLDAVNVLRAKILFHCSATNLRN